jgi:hypothetical protein
MLYQLPNGKTVNLDLADVLNINNQDIQYLLAINAGETIHNPFQGSVIKNNTDKPDNEEDENDDEVETYYEEFFPDEFPEIPDDFDFNVDLLED